MLGFKILKLASPIDHTNKGQTHTTFTQSPRWVENIYVSYRDYANINYEC